MIVRLPVFLTSNTGLKQTSCLQQLTVSVPFSTDEYIKTFDFYIRKVSWNKLAFFGPDSSYCKGSVTEKTN